MKTEAFYYKMELFGAPGHPSQIVSMVAAFPKWMIPTTEWISMVNQGRAGNIYWSVWYGQSWN